ncbi:multidrug effflux MFS transporter [Kineosporia sp. NBRC 101731]|uniref:multidrug effflux MFS transporter n=1 Tax=Kineosporia sp. NBRC 101731 TaxID=3032199 RepID=UPI0024A044E9|nr:multidrug effflux MFS transporter [Kineosporia sp. NBRC 101731]GLY30945.1 Bcr/CflA family drug resistance efflux transporter [Kineosporia sp. NBRC 101731]
MTESRRRRVLVLVVLAACVALGPLSTDVYVPGLPDLAGDLGASASAVQLTVTACLVGLAAGQLLAGPLSDARGRRGPLLFGLALYTLAGLLCAAAPTVALLVVLRAVQGIGGAFAVVIAYAYVRDRYNGGQAAAYFSLMLSVTGLAPVLAPLAGGLVLEVSGWREIFIGLGGLSALVLAGALRLPESHPASRRSHAGARDIGKVYRRLLKDPVLMGYTLTNALVFAAMFAYIAGSPFVLQQLHGLSVQQYSVVFAVNGAGIMAAAQIGGALVRRFGAHTLLGAGVVLSFTGSALTLVVALAGAGVWPTLVALFLMVAGVGLVLPNVPALALEHHGASAGAAAALLGCAQFLLGGLAAPLVGIGGSRSAVPMAVVMAGFTVAAVLTFAWCTRTRTRTRSGRGSGGGERHVAPVVLAASEVT